MIDRSLNDTVIVAYYSLNGQPVHYRFDFNGLPLGSPSRAARVAEYERSIQALNDQGVKVFAWSAEHWPRYAASFLAGKLK